ncbi:efflux RND transporter periplasmic adaptor subunit [Thiobaca trueperi]|uniref:RND family efflux transporter MFP subunit n=1 Tax=Thiobaca trueperi TaxID=127458 RepID=A0A4R3MTY8_9GAMM|nr:efflux RND transporter periplasmic adaptor subunit [Thiobaca trueperi]TCT18741.1 RND family efflux transporter MFP subunit [Thiobaca trueperi]
MRTIKWLAVLGWFLACGLQAAGTPTLDTAVVTARTLPREYRLDGLIEAVNRSTVSAQTSGQVQEMFYDVDDYVEKNAILVRLKDTEQRAQVSQAEADLKSATARLRQLKDEHERIAGLYRKKAVSDSAMDQATASLATAQADLDAATARLEQAREQLAYTEIRAPYSGIVAQRHIELGSMVNSGAPVMSGISLDDLRVIVDVPQSIIQSVRRSAQSGAAVRVYLPDGEVVAGAGITVFPLADPGSNTFKVRIDLPNQSDARPRLLFPGMFVKTGLVVGEKSVLTVPRSAVAQRSEVTGIYVVAESGRIHFRQIRLGQSLPDAEVVLAGLTEGERVALDPIAAGVALKSQRTAVTQETGHD